MSDNANGFKFFDVGPGQQLPRKALMAHFGIVPAERSPVHGATGETADDPLRGLSDEERAFVRADPKLADEYAKRVETARAKVAAEKEKADNRASIDEAHANLDRVQKLADRIARGETP